MSRAAIFLDRDGVLNVPTIIDGRPYPPQTLDELRPLPGVQEACRSLAAAGFRLIAITNQPDIARGSQDPEIVGAMNQRLLAMLELDEVVVCPHDEGDGCRCRKPRPGMILDAARRWDLDLQRSFTVGDRWRDIQAGRAAGTHTIFIDRHYDEPAPPEPDLTVGELQESISWIIQTADRPA